MKIRDKILIYFLVILVVPISFFSLVIIRNVQINLSDQVSSKLEAISEIQKNRLQTILSEKENVLKLFTSRVLLKNKIQEYNKKPTLEVQTTLNASLAELHSSVPTAESIMIADTKGIIISSFPSSLVGTNVSEDELFIEGIKKDNVSIFKKNLNSDHPDEYLTGPIVLDGQILGVVIFRVDSSSIFNIANDYSGLGETGETLFVKNDGKGNALFITPIRFDKKAAFSRVVLKSQTNSPALLAISGQEATFFNTIDYRGVPVFSATRFVPSLGWGIVVKIDKDEANAPLKNILFISVIVLLFIITFSVLVSSFVANSFTLPIQELTIFAKKLSGGDLSQRIVVTSRNEIGELAESFNLMTESIKEARSNVDKKVIEQTLDLLAKEKILEDQKRSLEQFSKMLSGSVKDLSKFKLAVDNVSDMIAITDPEGIMVYCNKMVKVITGYDQEEAIGKKAAVLWKYPMAKEIYEEMWKTIKVEKIPYRGQIKNKRKNGVIYDVDVLISPVLDENNEILFFVGIERDITHEKEVDRAKTEFVSLSSHQLRTPLSSINWNTEMLLSGDAGELNEKQKRFLKEVYSSSRRMVALIDAFLNVSRIEIGTFSGQPKPVNISEAAQDILKELHPLMEKRKQHLSENYDPNIPVIFTDIKMIHAVFQNLVSNAVKYTKEGGEVGVKTALSSDGKDILIEVSDNGIGIPEDQKHQIFEKFFRTEVAREIDTDGTGLGLYLLKLIAEKVGGEITFTSEINKGTTFFVKLPIEGLTSKDEKSLKPTT